MSATSIPVGKRIRARLDRASTQLPVVIRFVLFKFPAPPPPHPTFPFLSLACTPCSIYPSFYRILIIFRMRWSPNGMYLDLASVRLGLLYSWLVGQHRQRC
jgi:hypothetical protein